MLLFFMLNDFFQFVGDKFPFLVISSIALRLIFLLPELPEHSSANVTYVMVGVGEAIIPHMKEDIEGYLLI